MTNCRRTDISQYDDINTKDQYQVALDAGCTVEQALEACYVNSRDNARTPVQWSDAPHGGFTTGQPWLAVNPNYTTINVAEQEGREDSVLNHYRRLVALRKSAVYGETFTYGAFEPVWETEPDILAYLRRDEAHTILVAGNYGPEARTVTLPAPARELLLSNLGREELPAGTALTLASCESAVILL